MGEGEKMKKKISAGRVNNDYVNHISAERCETVQYAAVNHKLVFCVGLNQRGVKSIEPGNRERKCFKQIREPRKMRLGAKHKSSTGGRKLGEHSFSGVV